MNLTYKTRPPSVVIDGQNAARSKNGKACWNHVRLAVLHFCEIQIPVILVMPHWGADIEFKKEIRKVAKLQLVDTENDPEFDDKAVLGLCMVEDGYYVSNDKHMYKHLKGDLADRAWCANGRIGFHFNEEGVFVPHYPESWHSPEGDVGKAMDGATTNGKEVRK